MNGHQLLAYRKNLKLSQQAIADKLGDVSHATVSRWEAAGDEELPGWVTEKLLSDLQVSLPLTELHQLMDLARRRRESFPTLLGEALRSYIRAQLGEPLVAAAALAEDSPPYQSALPSSGKQRRAG